MNESSTRGAFSARGWGNRHRLVITACWFAPWVCGNGTPPRLSENPAPVAEPDLSERIERLIEQAPVNFEDIRWDRAPYPGRGAERWVRYASAVAVWGQQDCYIYPGAEAWRHACAFGYTWNSTAAAARYDTLKSDLQRALPELKFTERVLVEKFKRRTCSARVFSAEDFVRQVKLWVYYEKEDCVSANSIVFVVQRTDLKVRDVHPWRPVPGEQ